MNQTSFLKVATRPKWIGALILALAVAAVFGLLAQWQIDRTYRYVPKAPVSQTEVPLDSIAKSSSVFTSEQADRLVTENLTVVLSQRAYIIKNRVQITGNGEHQTGVWIARWMTTDSGKWVLVATDWLATVAEAKANLAMADSMGRWPVTGIYEPSEEARPANANVFETLSTPQLINQPGLPDNIDAYAGFLIQQQNPKRESQIVIGPNPGESVFNWLTAFYALEWTVFAGFAIFLWGRVVQDEVNRQNAKGRID